jgi:hypothetical protein
MGSWACQCGIAFVAVALAPLAGLGPCARAGYLVTDPAVRSNFSGCGLSDAGAAMGGATSAENPSDRRGHPSQGENTPYLPSPSDRLSPAHDALWAGLGQSGAGAGSVPTTSAGAGSALYAAVGARLVLSPVQLTGWLYIDELQSRPPHFPSRLFRPPRAVV